MRNYVVTGAASGIGKAVKEQLEAQGHQVVSVDIRDADVVADLSDSSQCQAAIEDCRQRCPDGLDGLVPCAGVGPEASSKALIPLVNYFATVELVEGLLPALESKRGAIVLISSNSSQMMEYDEGFMQSLLAADREAALSTVETINGQQAYGGGKQALARWMRHNSPRMASAGVRINAIAPGYTETGMTELGRANETYRDAIEQFVNSIPIGRAGLPEDQANAVLFLLSDKASFVTGSILFVDGGHDAVFRPDKY